MATHSSSLAWRIPWTEKPGGLQSTGSQIVRRDCRFLSRVRLSNPVDCSPPGFSVHGILQARILEWVAISSSTVSFRPKDQTQVSCLAGGFFATMQPRKLYIILNHWNIKVCNNYVVQIVCWTLWKKEVLKFHYDCGLFNFCLCKFQTYVIRSIQAYNCIFLMI